MGSSSVKEWQEHFDAFMDWMRVSFRAPLPAEGLRSLRHLLGLGLEVLEGTLGGKPVQCKTA